MLIQADIIRVAALLHSIRVSLSRTNECEFGELEVFHFSSALAEWDNASCLRVGVFGAT